MNPAGNQMMASGILKAFGLDESQMKKAHDAWLDTPHAVELKTSVSFRQWEELNAIAAKEHKSVGQVVDELLSKVVTPDAGTK